MEGKMLIERTLASQSVYNTLRKKQLRQKYVVTVIDKETGSKKQWESSDREHQYQQKETDTSLQEITPEVMQEVIPQKENSLNVTV